MGRPSVKEKRTEEILDAFEKCVAKYGVEGSTLERIAETAGLRRSLLRHFVGNKDELLDALVERFLKQSEYLIEQMILDLEGASSDDLLDYMFDDDGTEDHFIRVAQALFLAAPEHEKLSEQLIKWVASFDKVVTTMLVKLFPAANQKDCAIVATGMVGIYSNVVSLAPLGNIDEMRQTSKEAAYRLINTLETT